VVEKISEILKHKGLSLKEAKILIVGVSYKRDVNDTRESPALEIIKRLSKKKARVFYHDPYVSKISINGKVLKSLTLNNSLLHKVDLVTIVTDHSRLKLLPG